MSRRKTWADLQQIATGVWGEVVGDIWIEEANRVTVFEYRRAGIEVLQNILHENYRRKGVEAVLFGVEMSGDRIGYAIFVNPKTMPDGKVYTVSEDE